LNAKAGVFPETFLGECFEFFLYGPRPFGILFSKNPSQNPVQRLYANDFFKNKKKWTPPLNTPLKILIF